MRTNDNTGVGTVPTQSAGKLQQSHRTVNDYLLSHHARLRVAQRNLSKEDIQYVLQRGQIFYVANARIFFLRKTDIPANEQQQQQRLEGTAVVMAVDRPLIVTVWRNRQHGLRHIRDKSMHWWLPDADTEQARHPSCQVAIAPEP